MKIAMTRREVKNAMRKHKYIILKSEYGQLIGLNCTYCLHAPELHTESHTKALKDDILGAIEEAIHMYEVIQPVGGWKGTYDALLVASRKAREIK